MNQQVYWIDGPWPGRLGIVLRPRGGDWLGDETAAWRKLGVDAVVSALEKEEIEQFALNQEAPFVATHGMVFGACPIQDRGVPVSISGFLQTLREVETVLQQGKNVVVHCRQGIGRSALIAAGLLILEGLGASEALARVQRARGIPVPETSEQKDWLTRFANQVAATKVKQS